MARQPKSPLFWRCMAEVRRIAGNNLTETELVALANKFMEKARRLRAERHGITADEAVSAALQGLSDEMLLTAKLDKRAAYLTHAAFSREFGKIEGAWSDAPKQGLATILVGSNIARAGAQRSIDADQKGLANHYLLGMTADVERTTKFKIYASGEIDLETMKALDQLYKDDSDFTGIGRDARELATIIHKWQEVIRVDKNNAGAWILKSPDYISHQSHDMFKVSKAYFHMNSFVPGDISAARNMLSITEDQHFQAWRDFVVQRLDEEKTFGDMTAEQQAKWLRLVWRSIASGEHLRSSSAVNGWMSPSSLAGRLSKQRILHFADATARFEYEKAFGRGGSLLERVKMDLYHSGHQVALMRRLGPNPEETYRRLKKAIKMLIEDSVEARDKSTWERDERLLDAYFAEITGEAHIPGTDPFSTALRSVRVIHTLSKMGMSVISSISDVGIAATELAYQGVPLTSAWKTQMDGVLQGYGKRGQERAGRLQFASELGIAVDTIRSATWSRFSAEDALPGWATRMQHEFFVINGLMWWTDTLRMANAQAMSHNIAMQAGRSLVELDSSLQRLFKMFGISAQEWDLMRSRSVDVVENKEYFTPKGSDRLTDVEIAQLLKSEKVSITPRRVRERREEITTKFRDFFAARSDYAIVVPGPRTRVRLSGAAFGAEQGTPLSEIFRSVGQFKSFPAAVIEKVWGREIFGYGETGRMRDFTGTGMKQLAAFIVYSTFLGYVSMHLKAYVSGRDIKAPENAKEASNVLIAAIVQGGGAGIYGDFLLGQAKDRFGHSAFSSILGPSIGDTEDLFRLMKGGSETAAQSFSAVKSHFPLINLFYTRMALDYMILNRIQEEVSPGSLTRSEESWNALGQQHRLPPSSNFRAENLTAKDIGKLAVPFNR